MDDSQAGSVLGTPAYMAPEQAAGEVERVDRRADVFGLGSILCEILTGQPAYTGRSSAEMLRKAMRGDTADALARLDGCGADAELIALARDCLAVEPEDRPRDAGVVAGRITAYLAACRSGSRRPSASERWRWRGPIEERRRRKLQLALAAAVLALTTLGGLSTTYYLQQRAAGPRPVERVIDQVTTLRDQALAQPEDIPRVAGRPWPPSSKPSPPAIRDTRARLAGPATEIQAGLDAARRDQALLDRLVDIRIGRGRRPGRLGHRRRLRRRLPRGRDRPGQPAARRGGGEDPGPPAAVALALAAALDDWAAVRRGKRRRTRPGGAADEAARVADPDPWRDRAAHRPRPDPTRRPGWPDCRRWRGRRSSTSWARSACTCWGPA